MSEQVIPDFLQDLADATSKSNKRVPKELTVLNMRSPKNQGTTLIVPISGEGKGEGAIKQLNRVAHVEKWVSGKKQDGSEYGFVQKLYFFLDPKYYGELTEAQMQQLDRIKSMFNTANNGQNKGLGVHQFTIIQGLDLQHKDRSKPNPKMVYESIPALWVFESKNFEKSFQGAITNMADTMGDYEWLNEMCNRDIKRKRYFNVEFYRPDEGGGYTANIRMGKFDEDVAKTLTNGKVGLDLSDKGEDFMDKFKDPIKTFLGVSQDEPRFNEEYMNEIQAILTRLIKGEPTIDTREAKKPQGEPSKPDSNAGFKTQDENAPLPTNIGEAANGEAPVETAKSDEMPF